jgi:hypothetical protein
LEEGIMAWVTTDGEYNGSSSVIQFDDEALTVQQWQNLEEMADSDRYQYVEAILAYNFSTAKLIEIQNFGEE